MDSFDRIDALLKENGISGAKMSRDLGFSSGLYSQWKKRIQKPSADKLQKVADYLNVSVEYLLTGEAVKQNAKDEMSDEELKKNILAHYNKKLSKRVPNDVDLNEELMRRVTLEDLFEDFKLGNVSLDTFLSLIVFLDEDMKELREEIESTNNTEE